jgi:hypothetical protein
MAELGYQNPTVTTDAKLETTLVNPGDASGAEVRRQNVQMVTSSESRQLQEMALIYADDGSMGAQMRRHVERYGATDARGGTGRGSTR